jgi:uncharacterized protein
MPTVSFVILQPTPFCNIACKYCYLPDRSSRARMTLATIEKVFSGLFSSGWVGNELYVAWHGGEPLVLPTDYYERAFRAIADHTPAHVKVEHAFQTNGMLIDDAWCDFFKRHKATVGVSIDGPPEIHDANRVARSGKGTCAEAIEGIRCLRRNGVRFSVITVLSASSLRHPKELHDFYEREGITDVCFNVEEIEGTNAQSSLSGEEMQAAHASFMREFWNLNVASGALSYIREFKDMLQKAVRPSDDVEIDNTLTAPFEHVNVDYRGNFSTFSPEFLGHKNTYYGDFIIGNFWTESLTQSLESEAFKRLARDVAAGVEMCRGSCEYFPVCGGGSPVNKLYENGTIASTETMYCRLSVKAIADLAMDIIESSAAQGVERPGTEIRSTRAARTIETADLGGDEKSLPVPNNDRGRSGIVLRAEHPGENRLQASTGIVRGCGRFGKWSYEDGALIPDGAWRALTADELKALTAPASHKSIGIGIGVVLIPAKLLAPFATLRAAAAEARSEEDLATLLGTPETTEGMKELARYMKRRFQRPSRTRDAGESEGGIAVKPAGLPTVTVERSTGALIGLHVDDWYAFPLGRRHRAPNRICVNLGCEDRFLVFSNVPVDQMYRALERSGRKLSTDAGGTTVARAFMAAFPSLPVLRVRIHPGEAYIAPTENIAHDASSLGMSTMDVSLHMRGRFALSAA